MDREYSQDAKELIAELIGKIETHNIGRLGKIKDREV
jgi:hypothetical protein